MGMKRDVEIRVKAKRDEQSFNDLIKSFELVRERLNQSMKGLEVGTPLRNSLVEQYNSIQKMQILYENSFNKNLNTLNLERFNSGIKAQRKDWEALISAISTYGLEGKVALNNLLTGVVTTNREITKTKTLFDEMWNTMSNTIKWGISSSLMNKFSGSISEAYGYVKNLDKSLNDIRIVSGQSAEQMEKFARHANSAAQSLGASTLDYSNAALIYYQQGLGDEQVQQMTDITVKMSNVLGTSAEEVSNYMTAIWNNFNDGSKSLEYYADVITKLGAATASSAEEISTGLEKFAAVADTVGLSYEYATAALTTVTATTRQSAEVVGTAFKTLFARIQDLELGETLDDGTTLGKYSDALYKVGINIKDSNGELKEMDVLLNEMGSKWNTLTKAQQVSLAQTVAGTRQYTQLIALMDNWDYFTENLETAQNAMGALDEQQMIYLEGVEAHLESAKAAWDELKSSLLDEELITFFADLSKTIGNFSSLLVNSFGGGTSFLTGIGGMLTSIFTPQISQTVYQAKSGLSLESQRNKKIQQQEKYTQELFGDETGENLKYQNFSSTMKRYKEFLPYIDKMSQKTEEEFKKIIVERAETENNVEILRTQLEKANLLLSELAGVGDDWSFTNRNIRAVRVNTQEEKQVQEVQNEANKQILEVRHSGKKEEVQNAEIKKIQKEADKQIEKIHKAANQIRKQEQKKDKEAYIIEQKKPLEQRQELETFNGMVSQYNAEDSVNRGREFLDQTIQDIITTENKIGEILNDRSKFSPIDIQNTDVIDFTESLGQNLTEVKEDGEAVQEMLKVLTEQFGTMLSEEEIQEIQNYQRALEDVEKTFHKIEASDKKKDGTYKKRKKVQIEDINQIRQTTVKANEVAAASYEKVRTELVDTQKAMSEDNVKTFFAGKEKITDINKDLKVMKQEVQDIANIETKTEAIGGLMQITSGVSALGNAISIINDDSLSPFEKLSGVLYSVGAGFSFILTGLKSMAPMFTILNNTVQTHNILEATAITLKETSNKQAIKKAVYLAQENILAKTGNKLSEEEIAIEMVHNGQMTKEQVIRGGLITAKQLDVGLTAKETLLTALLTKAKAGLIVVLQGAKLAVNQLTAAMLANPVTAILVGITAAITAVVAALAAWHKAEEKKAEQDLEFNRAERDKLKQQQDENKNVLELARSYEHLHLQYKKGLAEKEDLVNIGEDLLKGLGEEELEIAKLTHNYADLTAKIKEYRLELLGKMKDEAKDQINEAGNAIVNSAIIGDGRKELGGYALTIGGSMFDDSMRILNNELQKAGIANFQTAVDNTIRTGYNPEEITKLYDTLEKARQRMKDEMGSDAYSTKAYSDINTWLEKMEEDVLAYKDSQKNNTDLILEEFLVSSDIGEVEYYEDYRQIRDTARNFLKNQSGYENKSEDEINSIVKNFIEKNIASDNIQKFTERDTYLNALVGKFGKENEDAIDSALDSLDAQQIAGLLDSKNSKVVTQLMDGLLKEEGYSYTNALIDVGEKVRDTSVPMVSFTQELEKQLEALGYSKEEFEEYVDQLQKLNPELGEDIEETQAFALANIRLSKGLTDLAENFDSIKDNLKENKRGTSDFAKALNQAQTIIADVLNLESGDLLSEEFYTSAENLKLMEQAAKGNTKAIEKLRDAAGDQLIKQYKAEADDQSIKDALDKLNNLVQNYDLSKIEVGMSVNDVEFKNKLNEYIAAAKMTKEQAEAYLNSMNLKGTDMTMVDYTIDHTYEFTVPWFDIPIKIPVKETLSYPSFGDFKKLGDSNTKPKTSSSGGSKSKKDLPKPDKDPYHDVNIELEQLQQRLEKIGKIKEGLLGQDYIDKLREEYELLNKTIEKTEEKLKIATKEQEKLKNSLAGMGAKFNSDGSISNYSALYDKEFKRYEDAVKKYNAGKLSEKNLEKAEERWKKFQEDLDKYDELLIDIIPELEMDILEKELEQFELKMDGFTYSIEMRLDLKEAEQDWNEFIKDLNYRDNEIMGEVVLNRNNLDSLFKEDGSGIIQSLTNQINNTIAEIEEIETTGSSDIYGTNKEQAMEDLETYAGEMREALLELQDIQDNLHQSYVDMMDETQEKLDEQIEAYETITDLIEHEKELISLTYGEDSYEELSALYDKQLENNKQQLDALRQQTAFWHSQMLTLKEGSDEWEAAKEKWLAAVQAEKEAILSSIQELQDWYLNEIDKMFDNINKNVTGGLGLDYASKEWDLINKNADQYLDNVNAIYSIQQLQNKYLDAIEKTDNLGTQKKLNDLMKQELTTLREQDKLSQYDIDRANLKYEIALKQMALEEAQQNKNTMRLRRDSQGNYTYQYVADEDEISSVQEELANLYNELYNMDYDKYRENLAEITEIWTEAQEQMREAAQINDPDERARQEKLIQEQYGQLINSLVEQNEALKSNMYQSTMSQLFDLYDQNAENYDLMTEEQKLILDNFLTEETNLEGAAFDNLFDLYNENIEQFKNMTDAQQEELMGSLLPQWETVYQQMADTIRGEGGFFEVYKTTFEDMKTLANEYLEMLLQITQSENYEEIKNSNEELFTNLEEFVGKTDEILEAYDAQLAKIAEVIAEVENLILKYKQAEESALAAAEAGQGVIEEEKKEDSTLDVDLDDNQDDTSDPDDGTDESDASKASNGAPFKDTYTVKPGDTLSGIGARYGVNYKSIYAANRDVIGSDEDLIKPGMKLKIPAYQSGGYTGDWVGTDGQLAMLHKKELVLNASDTKNLLGAMDILRSITDNLGASLFNTISAISAHGASPAWANTRGDSLQQDVHITAEFPNVTNSHEIEDALNNLVNHASQYIQK